MTATTPPDPSQSADLNETLKERGSVHGDFRDQATATQRLKQVMQSCPNWTALTHVHRDAAEMIAVKLGRILAGDPDHHDHWHDIAGYATLVARDIEARKSPSVAANPPAKFPRDVLRPRPGMLRGDDDGA